MSGFPAIVANGRGRFLILVVLTALLQALAAACAAIATRDIFATFLAHDETRPVGAFLVLAGSGLAIAAGRIGQATLGERLGQSFAGELRDRLFTQFSQMPRLDVQNQRRGGLALRFVGDLSAIRGWVGDGLPKAFASGFVLPAACMAGFLLHPMLGAVLCGCVCFALLVLALAARRLRPLHQALRRRRARLSADMSERAPQAPDLRLIGRMAQERARLRVQTQALTDAATARRRAGAIMRAVPDVVAAAAAALVLAVSLDLDLPTSLAAGGLAAAAIVVTPLRDLALISDRYSAFYVARTKCIRVFKRPILSEAADTPVDTSLTFREVSHGPLQNVSFTVPPGGTFILRGSNGSGKSTLLRLAAGLEEPGQGHTLIGAEPAVRAAPQSRVCLIDSHTPILAGSLRRSLTLGARKRPPDARIRDVAVAFGLASLLCRLGGLNGKISELGRNLSEGERWRVLLVRARLAKARIILLDCPDSFLSEDAEDGIVQWLKDANSTNIIAIRGGRARRACGSTQVLDLDDVDKSAR
ncbi:MAG: ABC transporter ATP-binding protein [Pseudomonadota bacterium]